MNFVKSLKSYVSPVIWDWTPIVVLGAGTIWTLNHTLKYCSDKWNKRKILNKWKISPKDIVVVHTIIPGRTVPNCSPFVVKLETFLRMADIPYQLDTTAPMSPESGKTPWITLNGKHMSDSQVIIEYLMTHFKKRIGNYSDGERAAGTLARVVLDEHFYWGLVLWRYVYTEGRDLPKIFGYPPAIIKMFQRMAKPKIIQYAFCQGSGRLTQEQVIKFMVNDLRAISHILGKKRYILGDEPSEDDCAIFGTLVEALWAAPGSPWEKAIMDEFPNLKEYCLRMKEKYWPDWDKYLVGTNN